MSEETKRSLDEAVQAERRCVADAQAEERACLADVSRGLPDELDRIAKESAHEEPEVSTQIGSEGIQQLRAELRTAAQALGAELVRSVDEIAWPEPETKYGRVSTRDVSRALFTYLHGERVDRLAQILKTYGYSIQEDARHTTQHLILPQYLFDEDVLAGVAAALSRLVDARRAVIEAKTAHDKSTVDDLWGS